MPYKVFLKAPTTAALRKKEPDDTFTWQIAESRPEEILHNEDTNVTLSQKAKVGEDSLSRLCTQVDETKERLLPPAPLGAASQRLSVMYRNVIFAEDDDEEDDWGRHEDVTADGKLEDGSHAISKEESFISWPPTNREQTHSRGSLSRALTRSVLETQDRSEDTSYAHTSTSSIAAFPTFVINLHTLTSLLDLTKETRRTEKITRKVNLLVAILEVDGPDVVTIRKGPEAGKEVGVLKMVIGGEEGGICKLTAWREVADQWGGVREGDSEASIPEDDGVKRGDIIYLQSVLASSFESPGNRNGGPHAQSSLALTASSNLGSRLHICYRTLPTIPLDRRFRPDLRLAASDSGLRKVTSVVRWLQNMMGLDIF